MVKFLILLIFFIKISFASNINIISTIKPLTDIAKEIVKEKANVDYLIPPNVSVHMYEYKISDIKKVANAEIFMYIGTGEPNIDNLIKIAKRRAIFPVSNLNGIHLIKNFEFNKEYKEDNHEEKFHPALWLDPYNAKIIAKAIYEKISTLDPSNRNFYKNNYENFAKKCDEIIIYGKEKISKLKIKDFISYHYAWPYFTKRFGLNYIAVIELGHGREPTIKHILSIIRLIKNKNIKSIFAAKQFYNPKYTDLIKKETGVNLTFLDPFGKNKGYIDMIKFNIDKVYEGLK